jgi:NAD(P)-dependent dehydrogenase (short-subunit alcohol dehydrogenase family)
MTLKGKTLFIIGASRSICLVIAKRAAAGGANIVIAAKTTEPNPKLLGTIYAAAKEIEARRRPGPFARRRCPREGGRGRQGRGKLLRNRSRGLSIFWSSGQAGSTVPQLTIVAECRSPKREPWSGAWSKIQPTLCEVAA